MKRTAGKSTVRILVLSEVGILRRDPNIGGKHDFVGHVPGVAVRDDDHRFG
jgi:hypothetical protein